MWYRGSRNGMARDRKNDLKMTEAGMIDVVIGFRRELTVYLTVELLDYWLLAT